MLAKCFFQLMQPNQRSNRDDPRYQIPFTSVVALKPSTAHALYAHNPQVKRDQVITVIWPQ